MLQFCLLGNLVEFGFLMTLMYSSESETPRNICNIYASVFCRKTHGYGRFFFNISRARIFSKLENLWLTWYSITLYSPWCLLILYQLSKHKRYQAVRILTWREVAHSADWTLDILRSSSLWIKNMRETSHSCILAKRLLTFGLEFLSNLFFNQITIYWNTVQILVLSRTQVTFTPKKQAV